MSITSEARRWAIHVCFHRDFKEKTVSIQEQTEQHISARAASVPLWSQSSGSKPTIPEFVARLGKGKAADVRLIKDSVTNDLYAEKVFKQKRGLTTLFRNMIYWGCFQAPFPYQTNRDAVQAALYRRKVLRDLTIYWFGRPLVANAYYSSWDEQAKGYLLGTEYIKGRGPRPGSYNQHGFRNLILNYPVRLFKRMMGRKTAKIEGPQWEIDQAMVQLDELKAKFHQAGFVGSEWQVDKMLSVPTSNLLKDGKGEWILVDVESGMPALIMLKHIFSAIRMGSFPLFDDTDFTRLDQYLDDNRIQLAESLGEEGVRKLHHNVNQLYHHTLLWKSSEPALFRHKHRLFTNSQLRSNIRRGYAQHWYNSGQISTGTSKKIESSSFRFGIYFWIDLTRSFALGCATVTKGIGHGLARFMRGVGLSLRLLYSSLFDEAYLKNFADSYLNERIDDWQRSGRLTETEVESLRQYMQSPSVAEYLKGFMAHLGLKLLEPPFVANIIAVSLAVIFDEPVFLLALFIGPILRTLYTLYRMVRKRGQGISYRTALIVGAIPKVGVLGFAIQMSNANPELSRFLARCEAAKFSSHIPLFGGKDSRIEHAAMKVTDFGASMHYELYALVKSILPSKNRKRRAA